MRQQLWMIIACPLVGAIAGGILPSALPPVYEAHVTMYVKPAQPFSDTGIVAAPLIRDSALGTYAAWMTQRPIVDKVNSQLGLGMRYEDLVKKITVTPVASTLLLDVAVQDAHPALAADIANLLVADLMDTVKQAQAQAQTSPTSRPADYLIVLSPAVPPDKPVSANKALNVAIGFAAGLLLAVGLLRLRLRRNQLHGYTG